MDAFDNIFDTFSSVSKEEWKNKVIADLKGKAFEELLWRDEDGIDHQPYYNLEDMDFQLDVVQKKEAWKVAQSYELNDWGLTELKKELELAFDNGLELAIVRAENLKEEEAKEFSQFDQLFWHTTSGLSISNLLQDPIAAKIQGATVDIDPKILLTNIGEGKILVDGKIYAQKGASASQEIAYLLWHITEYFDLLTEAGMSPKEIADRLIIKCSIGSSYFSQLSKIRALRSNVRSLFAHYDLEQEPLIWAESNAYYLDSESFNSNLIRMSCQAMSAILGNSDWVSLSMQAAGKEQKNFAARMCRNIQLILKHESHLDEVDDLVRGAYYIENLSKELKEKSWDHFLQLEKKGSLLGQLRGADFWKEIESLKKAREEAYQNGDKVMVGVNKYPFEEKLKGGRLKEIQSSLSDIINKEA